MDVKKQLLSFVRMFLPAVGFALTCIGAYLLSLQTEHSFHLKLVPSYAMIVFGFLAMLTGVFWNLYSMRSKMYQRRRRERHIQIFTVARPSSFPPSYEESQSHISPGRQLEGFVSADRGVMSPAPPLYSQDSSEAPDCTWSWEHPPRYSQVLQTPRQQTDAGEQSEVSSSN
ncbi:transmembrane protein 252-like [Nematolebias whitei]|uniref:transmembrane protein 252-like n=1 Tax=Nematolebias whitei TaxID=451745 RepID=UPI0018981BA8|nr:transmembrane protein 252-like [Nematolebias whitei]